jgi:hypothetical protein
VALLALVLGVGAASRKISQTNQKDPSQTVPVVVNKTNAIKATDISVTPNGTVEVTLLNQSAKLISFYTFAIGDGHVMPISGIGSGSSTVQRFLLSDFVTSEGTKRDLTILALSFGGGGGEGDPEEVFKLEETTQGMKEQFEACLPALNRAASSQTPESEELVRTFESDIAQASVGERKDIPSEARKGGRHLAKLIISNDVQELRNRKRLDPNKTYKNGLAERFSHYQKIVSEL